jgi:gamma-glutamyltranspeptidase / glutathione hydrolase
MGNDNLSLGSYLRGTAFILITVVLLWVGWWFFNTQSDQGIVVNRFSQVLNFTPERPQLEAVTSNHYLATEAGLAILDRGGTAADAAFAVATMLSVVEPWFSSVLGGGTWALYYEADTARVTSLDGVGVTGSKATTQDYAERAGEPGMHQANVPGAWAGWLLWLEEYGHLELREIIEPAIRVAREGYPATGDMVTWLDNQATATLARAEARRIYAPNGELVKEGELVYQRELADTLEGLVKVYEAARPKGRAAAIRAGHDYFYRGPLAEKIVAFSDAQGGYLTLADFANTTATIREPIKIDYKEGIVVYQNPPNSQGISMLLALNILKGFDLSVYAPGSAESIHLQAEALKLAFADRHYHVGDPARISVPVNGLLSERHADSQRARINLSGALEWPMSDGYEPLPDDVANTTTFHVVDRFGNGAAVTTSLGAQFLPVADTGIHINHRMRFLQIDEGPNQVAPGFKVRHTSNPYLALRNNQLYILGGNTGADSQPQGQVQQFVSVVEHGLSPQEAVSLPRFMTTAFPGTVYPYPFRNTLQLELENDELVAALEARGHTVTVGEGVWGTANMLVFKKDLSDVLIGHDPRVSASKGEKKLFR